MTQFPKPGWIARHGYRAKCFALSTAKCFAQRKKTRRIDPPGLLDCSYVVLG
jgi:hypothetical protein